MPKINIDKLTDNQLNALLAKVEGGELLFVDGYWKVRWQDGQTEYLGNLDYCTSAELMDSLLDTYKIGSEIGVDSWVSYTNKYWWPEDKGGTDTRCEFYADDGDRKRACAKVLALAHFGEEPELPENLQ